MFRVRAKLSTATWPRAARTTPPRAETREAEADAAVPFAAGAAHGRARGPPPLTAAQLLVAEREAVLARVHETFLAASEQREADYICRLVKGNMALWWRSRDNHSIGGQQRGCCC